MANLFSSTDYPEGMPLRLVVGDRWLWKRTDLGADYAPASYALTYALRRYGVTTGGEIEITANESGTDYLIEVASSTTTSYTPGWYDWQMYITRSSDSERITLESGRVEVVANRDAANVDPRNHNRKMLDLLEAALEALAEKNRRFYTIGDRSVTNYDIPELRAQRDVYAQRVAEDEREENMRRGKGGGRRIRVRLYD